MCVIQNEVGDEWVFKGDETNNEFCDWLFTKEHANCVVLAHNFQGYDSYFILHYLHENGVVPEIIMCGAKILMLSVPILGIKFIYSLSFIPMKLAYFPTTFGLDKLIKGYLPHNFNTKENEQYVSELPDPWYYNQDGMLPDSRTKFFEWYQPLKDNYVFDFEQEILSYC